MQICLSVLSTRLRLAHFYHKLRPTRAFIISSGSEETLVEFFSSVETTRKRGSKKPQLIIHENVRNSHIFAFMIQHHSLNFPVPREIRARMRIFIAHKINFLLILILMAWIENKWEKKFTSFPPHKYSTAKWLHNFTTFVFISFPPPLKLEQEKFKVKTLEMRCLFKSLRIKNSWISVSF